MTIQSHTVGKLHTSRLVQWGALVMATLLLLVSLIAVLFLREQAISTWRRQLDTLSLVLAAQTDQSMVSAKLASNHVYKEVNTLLQAHGENFDSAVRSEAFHRFLRDTISGLPHVDVATLVAGNGDVINFSRAYPAPPINLADRDYFQAQVNDSAPGMFFSVPVRNKGNGKWVFYLSRRLNDAQGKFMGLVLVGVSVEQLLDFHSRIGSNLGSGASITLYRDDFTVLTRWPANDEVIGRKNLTGTTYSVMAEQGRRSDVVVTNTPRLFDAGAHVSRMGAVRAIDGFPLIVNLTVTEDLFLATWRQTAGTIFAVSMASLLALIWATAFLLRTARERDASMVMLTELAGQVPGMLFQFKRTAAGEDSFPYLNRALRDRSGSRQTNMGVDAATIFDFQHPADKQHVMESIQRSAESMTPWQADYRVQLPNRGIQWRHGDAKPLRQADGSTVWYGYVYDITERKQAEEQLRLAASVFTHAREGITITELDGRIVDVNAAFTHITGYSRDEVIGQSTSMLSSGRQGKAFYEGMWKALVNDGNWSGEIWNRRKNGEVYAEMLTISTVRDANGQPQRYVALFSDITAAKEHQTQLEHIAHFDALTGLPNRVLLADRLRQALIQAQRRMHLLAVAYIDLDGFKQINDAYGHAAGDQLLIVLSQRMKQVLREGDTLARLGGDEFVAVLTDLTEAPACVGTLTRLLDALNLPVRIEGHDVHVSASIGVTFFPQPEEMDADLLLRQSDQAMYQAKLSGKNRYHFFDADQDRSVRGHHESLDRIRRALANNEFVLHYQPKVNMRTGAVIGAEALIRWLHPEKGQLPPSAFLPVIEDHPLAVSVGEWVIETALTQIETWQRSGLHLPVSVNVGARQLQESNFVDRLRGIVAAHPTLRPRELELELLETSALEDITHTSGVIKACRDMGIEFALDDFGTGYSSLTYLKRLPVAMLKIDQSFVRNMLDDPDDLAILKGVISLAAAFKRQVIAEGVESDAHGEMLLQMGCELAQGYGIARPMPAEAIADWIAHWRPSANWSNGIDLNSTPPLV